MSYLCSGLYALIMIPWLLVLKEVVAAPSSDRRREWRMLAGLSVGLAGAAVVIGIFVSVERVLNAVTATVVVAIMVIWRSRNPCDAEAPVEVDERSAAKSEHVR